jgi:hypothetical protein
MRSYLAHTLRLRLDWGSIGVFLMLDLIPSFVNLEILGVGRIWGAAVSGGDV